MNFIQSALRNIVQHGSILRAGTVLVSVGFRSAHLLANAKMLCPVTPCTQRMETVKALLRPETSLISQVAGFKVKGRLKRRCKDCYFVMRQQRLYVICKTHPRHKQMAMKARDYKSWILTHATQSKIRPY